MTVDRYNAIYNSLKQNRTDFDNEVERIENDHEELRRFNEEELKNALDKVYALEDKALMVRRAFRGYGFKNARDEIYQKLYLIVGFTSDERIYKLPTNKRMLNEMCENLESIIDDFFNEIGYGRPKEITPLTDDNQEDENVLKKVREDAYAAKLDPTLVDPGVKERAEKLEKLIKSQRRT